MDTLKVLYIAIQKKSKKNKNKSKNKIKSGQIINEKNELKEPKQTPK